MNEKKNELKALLDQSESNLTDIGKRRIQQLKEELNSQFHLNDEATFSS
ncbi:hypothetical protein ACJ2A9_16390 [Anaerobacillus sp. MEB173]